MRKHGYIWNVFDEPAARRNGERQLWYRPVDSLRRIGCTKLCFTPPTPEGVYLAAGFKIAKEMRLDLAEPA